MMVRIGVVKTDDAKESCGEEGLVKANFGDEECGEDECCRGGCGEVGRCRGGCGEDRWAGSRVRRGVVKRDVA
jgi:hypothetical protein